MEDKDVLLKKIFKYAKLIESGEKIEHSLNRLERISMTLDLLSKTGIGKIVNRLCTNEKFGNKASKIVENWRNMARNTQKHRNNNEKTYSNETSNNKVKNLKHKIVNEDEDDEDEDEDSAANTNQNYIPKRFRINDQIVASIEESLAESVRSFPSKPIDNKIETNEEDATMFKARKLSHKVYAGRKKTGYKNGQVPKLFDICLKFCLNNIDSIEETGNVPFFVLKPVLEKCTHLQLSKIESKNRYLEEDTDYLWEIFCHEKFPNFNSKPIDETWKRYFLRLKHKEEINMKNHLNKISERINNQQRNLKKPQLTAMLSDPIAPRDARRRQIKNGTICHSSTIPNAAELSRSRRQIFESGDSSELKKMPLVLRSAVPSTSTIKHQNSGKNYNPLFCSKPLATPKHGALMKKTLKMFKSRLR